MTTLSPSGAVPREARNTGEKNGMDYHFVTSDQFQSMIKENRFAEWAIVHNHYYGTDKKMIETQMAKGNDVILSIDVQGADKILKIYPNSISIFIHTPSFEELKKRLMNRQSDSEASILKRLEDAKVELEASTSYVHHVINDEFERAVAELMSIIEFYRKKS